MAQIQEQLVQLQKDFDYLATQDQMFFGHEDLQLYKMVYGLAPFPVIKLFPLTHQYKQAMTKSVEADSLSLKHRPIKKGEA